MPFLRTPLLVTMLALCTVTARGQDLPNNSEAIRASQHALQMLKVLIGTWEGVTPDGQIHRWSFTWNENKSFINNHISFRNPADDGELAMSGMLGWDQESERLTNWCILPGGAKMTFVWSAAANGGWDVENPEDGRTWHFAVENDEFHVTTGSEHYHLQKQ